MYKRTLSYLLPILSLLLISACSSDNNQSNTESQAPSPETQIQVQTSVQPLSETTAEKQTLIWVKPGFAPLFINDEPFKGQGMGDLIFDRLQTLLPQYHHASTKAYYTRIIAEMRNGTNMCALLLYNQTQEDFALFSKPVGVFPNYQIFASLEAKAQLDKTLGYDVQQTTTDELLANTQDLTLLITPHQSYGKAWDTALNKHKDALKTQYHLTDQPAMMKLLSNNVAQLMLAMPWIYHYEENVLELHGRTAKIELTDIPRFQPAYIACTKTRLGRKVIDTINNADPAIHTLLHEDISSWLLPEELEAHRKAHEEYFSAKPASEENSH